MPLNIAYSVRKYYISSFYYIQNRYVGNTAMIFPFFVHCQSFYSKFYIYIFILYICIAGEASLSLTCRKMLCFHCLICLFIMRYHTTGSKKKIILALKLFAEQTGLSPIWLKIMHQYCVCRILILSADSINTVRFSILNLNIVQVFARQAG